VGKPTKWRGVTGEADRSNKRRRKREKGGKRKKEKRRGRNRCGQMGNTLPRWVVSSPYLDHNTTLPVVFRISPPPDRYTGDMEWSSLEHVLTKHNLHKQAWCP